jgi:signal transduction histidine kinase
MIWGDAFRLRQLADNLVGNALKYTRPGGSVDVSVRRDGSMVELVVADTGIGIAESDLPRIFEPYFRSETAVESGIPGTGLGLGIVRTIVEAHGGTIHIDSALGVGTTVTTRIPAEAT